MSRNRKKSEKSKSAAVVEGAGLRGLEWLIPAVLLLAVAIAYSNSFSGPFIYDDLLTTVDNPHIRHLWPLTESATAIPQTAAAGRPVVALSLALNYALGGLDVWGYHAFNLAIHVLAVLTLFGIVRRSLLLSARSSTGDPAHAWLAGSIALIWGLHPLATEAVDYIIQRTELLASLFLMLMLYCLIRGSSSIHKGKWYGAAVAACGLGMGSKEIMAGAPLIALLYDRVFLSGSWRRVWESRKFVHLGLACTWAILVVEIGSRSNTVGFQSSELTSWNYAKTQCGVILHYLRLSLWPAPLSIDYVDWPVANTALWATPTVAVMLVLAGLTLWAFFRKPWLGFLGSCFFIVLAPTSSFVPILSEVVAERRMYLPLAAVVSLIVIAVYSLARKTVPRSVLLVSVIGLACTLGAVTYKRNEDYKSELSIWRDVMAKRPANARAYGGVGVALGKEGKYDDAISNIRKALELRPAYPEALNDLGALLARKNLYAEAIPLYRKSLKLSPAAPDTHFNLATALHHLGNLDEAEAGYREALKLSPEYVGAHNNLGLLLLTRGRIQEAADQWREAQRLDPSNPDVLKNLKLIPQTQAH